MEAGQVQNPYRLDGRVALVTGGGTGIGLGIAQCLSAAGARVVIVGRREETLHEAARTIGPDTAYRVFDVTAFDQVGTLIEDVRGGIGPVSILVNNAGTHLKKPACDVTEAEFHAMLDTHVLASHALTRAAVPAMREAGGGSVVMLASMTSFIGQPRVVAYSAAKSAILGMVRTYAVELAPDHIRVNAVAPGWIESPMLHRALNDDPPRKARILQRTPMARFGSPADIGHAVTFLCSPAARFITGTVLPVDGGASIGF